MNANENSGIATLQFSFIYWNLNVAFKAKQKPIKPIFE